MAKTVGANLATHLTQEVTTLAILWKITRKDTTVIGFTAHDKAISYGGVTYEANTGFSPTAVESKNDLSVDNFDVTTILSSDSITEEDIMAGLYNDAR